MRALILGAMIASGAIAGAAAQDQPGNRGPLFVSPMGEPFRGAADGKAPHDRWFDGADTNGDGVLTVEEMIADGARFFAALDVRHDGEIDPDDIERYENELLPEVRGGGGAGEARRGYLKGDGTGPHHDDGFGSPPSSASRTRAAKQGAARFGYLDYPQPITVADRNFNRGVDPREFAKAAETRFGMLDSNGDRRIEKSELPRLTRSPRD